MYTTHTQHLCNSTQGSEGEGEQQCQKTDSLPHVGFQGSKSYSHTNTFQIGEAIKIVG